MCSVSPEMAKLGENKSDNDNDTGKSANHMI